MILVTNNENHFARIPGLKIQNWKKQNADLTGADL